MIEQLKAKNIIVRTKIELLVEENKKVIEQYELFVKNKNLLISEISKNKKEMGNINTKILEKEVENGEMNWGKLLDFKIEKSRDLLNKSLKQSCLDVSGYFPDNEENALKLTLRKQTKDKDILKTASFLKEYVKHSKPRTTEIRLKYDYQFKGEKIIDVSLTDNKIIGVNIFEHTLSEYNSYNLIFIQNNWIVVTSRFSTYEIIYTNKDLVNVLNYIKINHYY